MLNYLFKGILIKVQAGKMLHKLGNFRRASTILHKDVGMMSRNQKEWKSTLRTESNN